MYPTRPAKFTYHRPASVEEAVALLGELEDARPLAGGHSLLPAMKLRLSTPAALVDLGRIPGLGGIEPDGDGVRIGALATHAEVACFRARPERRAGCSAEAASLIGDRQVRNRGTIGGSLAHADPGADYPTVVTALGATITVVGPRRRARDRRPTTSSPGIFATALEPGELSPRCTSRDRRPVRARRTSSTSTPPPGTRSPRSRRLVSVERRDVHAARVVVGGVDRPAGRSDGRGRVARRRGAARPMRSRRRRRSCPRRSAMRSATATPRPSTARISRRCSRGGRSRPRSRARPAQQEPVPAGGGACLRRPRRRRDSLGTSSSRCTG